MSFYAKPVYAPESEHRARQMRQQVRAVYGISKTTGGGPTATPGVLTAADPMSKSQTRRRGEGEEIEEHIEKEVVGEGEDHSDVSSALEPGAAGIVDSPMAETKEWLRSERLTAAIPLFEENEVDLGSMLELDTEQFDSWVSDLPLDIMQKMRLRKGIAKLRAARGKAVDSQSVVDESADELKEAEPRLKAFDFMDEDIGKATAGLGAETLLESVVSKMKGWVLAYSAPLSKASAEDDDDDVKYPPMPESTMAVSTTKKKLDRSKLFDKLRVVQQAFADEGMGHTVAAKQLEEVIAIVVESGSFQNALKKAIRLLRDIRPFDIAEFLKLYGKTAAMSDALLNQSCWLFLGPKGSGKSTTLHYLAGSEMRRGDGGHIYPMRIVNPALASMPSDAVRVGQSLSTSETRYIAGVPMDLSTVADLDVDDSDRCVVFVDSPGFEDAGGPEIDLVNVLGMVRSLRKAKRVKLIVVLSKSSFGTRMLTLKKLVTTLSGILVDYKNTLKERTTCLLTKAEEGVYEIKDFRKDFRKVFDDESAKETIDKSFKFFAERLSKRTGPMPAKCVWPLRPELRKDVLQTIVSDTEWIEYPKRAFQEFVNGDTLAKLREQMAAYKKSIIALCADLDPAKCHIISARLSLMRQMCEVLPMHAKLREYLDECKEIAVENERIVAYVESLKERAKMLYVSVERSDELEKVGKLMTELRKLSQSDDATPNVKQTADELFASLKKKVMASLRKVQDDYDLDKCSLEHLRNELAALKKWHSAFDGAFESESQRTLVTKCTERDLTVAVLKPLHKRIEGLKMKLGQLIDARDARKGDIAAELKKVERFLRKVRMIDDMDDDDCDEEVERVLKEAGFGKVKEVNIRKRELKKQLEDSCADLDEEISKVNAGIVAIQKDADAVAKFAAIESEILADGFISDSDVIRYRGAVSQAKARISKLEREVSKGDDFKLPPLNTDNAVSALQFVTQCASIARADVGVRPVSKALDIARKRLEDYLFAYAQQWENAVSDSLETCATVSVAPHSSDSDSSSLGRHLQGAAETLAKRLRELQTVCDCGLCQHLFRKLPNKKVAEVYEIIVSIHSKLSTSITKWKRSAPEMRVKASENCQALSSIDDFSNWAAALCLAEAVSFAELAEGVFVAVSAEIRDLVRSCIPAFDGSDFQTVQTNLNELQRITEVGSDKVIYTRIASQLCARLSQMLATATMSVLQLNELMSDRDLYALNESLVNLCSAMLALENHIPAAMRTTIEAKETSLKKLLCERLLMVLSGAQKAAESAQFVVAERKLAFELKLCRFLGGRRLFEEDTVERLEKGQEKVRTSIAQTLKCKCDAFKAVDLVNADSRNPYTKLQTKRLFEEMRAVWDENPEYKAKWEEIELDIIDKVNTALHVVVTGKYKVATATGDERVEVADSSRRRRLLRLCEATLRWLPEEVSEQLKPEIEDAKLEFAEVSDTSSAESQ